MNYEANFLILFSAKLTIERILAYQNWLRETHTEWKNFYYMFQHHDDETNKTNRRRIVEMCVNVVWNVFAIMLRAIGMVMSVHKPHLLWKLFSIILLSLLFRLGEYEWRIHKVIMTSKSYDVHVGQLCIHNRLHAETKAWTSKTTLFFNHFFSFHYSSFHAHLLFLHSIIIFDLLLWFTFSWCCCCCLLHTLPISCWFLLFNFQLILNRYLRFSVAMMILRSFSGAFSTIYLSDFNFTAVIWINHVIERKTQSCNNNKNFSSSISCSFHVI